MTTESMAVSSPCSPASDYVESGGDSHENPAVTLFREYLRIPSVSRGEDYKKHYGEVMLVCVRRVFDLGWKLNDRLKFVYGLSSGCLGLKHPWTHVQRGSLLILKTIPHTQQATKVQNIVWISLKMPPTVVMCVFLATEPSF